MAKTAVSGFGGLWRKRRFMAETAVLMETAVLAETAVLTETAVLAETAIKQTFKNPTNKLEFI